MNSHNDESADEAKIVAEETPLTQADVTLGDESEGEQVSLDEESADAGEDETIGLVPEQV